MASSNRKIKSLTPKLYHNLIIQLNKDLLLSGIDLKIDSNCKPDYFVKQLSSLISNLVKNNYQTFNQFMYTLDVSEDKVNSINETDFDKLIQKITVLVLERLFQKVFLKDQFKNI
ncbi:MAG: hypothetical protein L3J45_05040 [Flavobacteriaceae bacterium]|nr:hypothetical protein [Flavobacteriaceae bacterium]